MNNRLTGSVYIPERARRESQFPQVRSNLGGKWTRFRRIAAFAGALVVAAPLVASAQSTVPARVTDRVDTSQLVTLAGNTHPLARAQYDQGAAPPDLPMNRIMLILKRGADQEASLQDLLMQQQITSSPAFHKWLTPDQFGQQFGPADADVQAVTGWLASFGFQSIQVSKGRTVIEFSGTAASIEAALHTSIHRYVVNGESYWANSSDPQIPAALAPVVTGFLSLHNFPKKPASVRSTSMASLTRTQNGRPQITFTDGSHGLAPADFNTIYNVAPSMTGAGVTIGVVARSNIVAQDVTDFRNLFQLGGSGPNIILNGPDPGDLGGGEEAEAVLDATWPGAVAPSATVDMVVSESTNAAAGEDLSEFYIIDNNLADVMTESFAVCEAIFGSQLTSAANYYSALAEQAAAQGITYMVASGDSGPDTCDDPSTVPVTPQPASVNLLASTPFTVAVGGTQFNDTASPSTYWNATNNPTTLESAKSYIPENVWNESCTVAQCGSSLSGLWSSGGGESIAFPRPPWQAGVTGIPAVNARFVPDVALTAANHDGYVLCIDTSCEGSNPGLAILSGTSVSAQAFGGIMALVVQKTGARVGIANYSLYKLAATEPPTSPANATCNASNTTTLPAATCIFNDVTVGNTNLTIVGEAGFAAGTGYDEATGLGSVNVTNLVNKWSTAIVDGTTTTLTLNSGTPVSVTHGTAVPVGITVAPVAPATGTPTGDVSLLSSNSASDRGIDAFTLSGGSVNSGLNSTIFLPGGTYQVHAHYEGDGKFLGSDSSAVTVTVTPEGSQINFGLVVTNAITGACATVNSITYGSPYVLTVDVADLNITSTPCAPSVTGSSPTGTVTLTDTFNSVTGPLDSGTFKLNSFGYFEDQAIQLPAGSHTIKASYSGDNSFNPSGPFTGVVTVSQAATTTIVSASSTAVASGTPVTLTATVSTQSNATANASQEPNGSVQFLLNGLNLGSAVPVVGGVNGISLFAQATASINPTLANGQDVITAKYLGDTNYAASSPSQPVTVTVGSAGISISSGCSGAITIGMLGQSGSCLITATGGNGFVGTVVLSAALSGTPAGASDVPACSFGQPAQLFTAPATITLTGSAETGNATMTCSSTAASNILPPPSSRPASPAWPLAGAAGAIMSIFFLLAVPRERRWRVVPLALLLAAVATALVACGGSSSSGGGGVSNPGTTAGTYTYTVTATPSSGAAEATVITLNVQ